VQVWSPYNIHCYECAMCIRCSKYALHNCIVTFCYASHCRCFSPLLTVPHSSFVISPALSSAFLFFLLTLTGESDELEDYDPLRDIVARVTAEHRGSADTAGHAGSILSSGSPFKSPRVGRAGEYSVLLRIQDE
jgi:hypothetical protein